VLGKPDFDRVRRTLLLQGEPDRVPIMEQSVDGDVKQAFLGKPIQSLDDEVEFWITAGYDYVPLAIGIRSIFRTGTGVAHSGVADSDFGAAMKTIKAKYSVLINEEKERAWAEEGTGILAGRAEFDSIKWPDPDSFDYSALEDAAGLLPAGAKLIVSIGYIYATVTRLMGFQNFCEKLIDDPDLVARVFERVGQIQLRVFENVVTMDAVGATWQPDDVAYVSGTMIAPKHLRQHVWPWYREMCRVSRQLGKPIIYHSDGKLDPIMDDILDVGFTSLHPIEPKPMNIEEIKARYGDRISLIGNIDLGYTLTRGTPEEVDAEVRERIRAVAPGGGYAVGSANSVTEYVPLANFNAMREAAFKYGRYPLEV
jgi:uroporphyrinogen decarboxylase